MVFLLAGARVFVSLCFPVAPEGCVTSPVVIEAEVWSDHAVQGVQVQWFIDGALVASDRLFALEQKVKRLAMILEPVHLRHRVEVAAVWNGAESRDRLVLPPLCPSLLQLESFRWTSQGLQVQLANLGPGPSGRVGLRWMINGLLSSALFLDPLPAGASAELYLPASASPLLEKALTTPGKKGDKRLRLTPVVVRLEAVPGPPDLESPRKSWEFFVGYAGVGTPAKGR